MCTFIEVKLQLLELLFPPELPVTTKSFIEVQNNKLKRK